VAAENQESEHFPDLLSFAPPGRAATTLRVRTGATKLLREKEE